MPRQTTADAAAVAARAINNNGVIIHYLERIFAHCRCRRCRSCHFLLSDFSG